jgi:hypothetical protein
MQRDQKLQRLHNASLRDSKKGSICTWVPLALTDQSASTRVHDTVMADEVLKTVGAKAKLTVSEPAGVCVLGAWEGWRARRE